MFTSTRSDAMASGSSNRRRRKLAEGLNGKVNGNDDRTEALYANLLAVTRRLLRSPVYELDTFVVLAHQRSHIKCCQFRRSP